MYNILVIMYQAVHYVDYVNSVTWIITVGCEEKSLSIWQKIHKARQPLLTLTMALLKLNDF